MEEAAPQTTELLDEGSEYRQGSRSDIDGPPVLDKSHVGDSSAKAVGSCQVVSNDHPEIVSGSRESSEALLELTSQCEQSNTTLDQQHSSDQVLSSDAQDAVPPTVVTDGPLTLQSQSGTAQLSGSRTRTQRPDHAVARLIQQADKSAGKLVNLLAHHFPSFRDETRFDGRKVRLLKRAQIFVADLWAALNGTGLGDFHDIDHLTMFAGKLIQHAESCSQPEQGPWAADMVTTAPKAAAAAISTVVKKCCWHQQPQAACALLTSRRTRRAKPRCFCRCSCQMLELLQRRPPLLTMAVVRNRALGAKLTPASCSRLSRASSPALLWSTDVQPTSGLPNPEFWTH